jgi:hypothetical protein
MLKRQNILAALLSLVVLGMVSMRDATAESSDKGEYHPDVVFTQRDKVLVFNAPPPVGTGDGTGRQVGTVTGRIYGRTIEGTSIVSFQFFIDLNQNNPDGTEITFENKVSLVDLSGGQLVFVNDGAGLFVPPLDPDVFEIGGPLGGRLGGSYVLIDADGKYSDLKDLPLRKRTFCYRAVASNPPGDPASPENLGTVFVQVRSGKCDD